MKRHEIILNQVSQSVQSLSKKIKLRYTKLSWHLAYNQDSDILVRSEECFTMQVGFNYDHVGVLDLNVQLDDNNNLRIDAGLVEGNKLTEELKNKKILGHINKLFEDYRSNEGEVGLNNTTRLRTLLNLKKSNVKSIKAHIQNIMDQIEIAFMLVMSQLRTV